MMACMGEFERDAIVNRLQVALSEKSEKLKNSRGGKANGRKSYLENLPPAKL